MYRFLKLFAGVESSASAIETAVTVEPPKKYSDASRGIGWADLDSLMDWERRIDALAEHFEKLGDNEKEAAARRVQLLALRQIGEIVSGLGPDEWVLICRRRRSARASSDASEPPPAEAAGAA